MSVRRGNRAGLRVGGGTAGEQGSKESEAMQHDSVQVFEKTMTHAHTCT